MAMSDSPDRRITKSPDRKIALVTGTLAEPAVRRMAEELAGRFDVQVHVIVLNIQVAALMTADWVGRKLELPDDVQFDRVILTGYLRGDVDALSKKLGVPVELGPPEVQDLPMLFGDEATAREDYGEYDIEIIAEINHACELDIDSIVAMADALRRDGADVIDIGCDPSSDRPAWKGLGQVVRELVARGFCVSVDSMHVGEIESACAAGAQLVLSVNSTNCHAAGSFGTEVVVIPDDPRDLAGLDKTISYLSKHGVAFRIDPIIEPIGCGFSQSLSRYLEVRSRYRDAQMMMGIGNLSEMTQVDSAGVNTLLIGFCQELSIGSVLTTQVINYARTSVREINAARRLRYYAAKHNRPAKHLDDALVMLRDEKLRGMGEKELAELAAKLRDRNYRIFAEDGRIHIMNKDVHVSGDDPFDLFEKLPEGSVDESHAFYLGFEMAKALTAITLQKNYVQDQALNWGMLTRLERNRHEK
jgi:dihydropteroate synthase-like protein